MSSTLSIGSVVWKLTTEIRHYAKDEKGRSFGGLLRRPQWIEWQIQGETSRSWIAVRKGISPASINQLGVKIPKRATPDEARQLGFALSEKDIEDDVWQHEHRNRVMQAVQRVDVETLRKIAEMIGYQEPKA